MVFAVKLLGIIIVIISVSYMLNPDIMKKYVDFWIKGKRLYVGGVISILFSVLFFMAASQCTLPMVITIMGIWALIKGILFFVLGPEKLAARIKPMREKPVATVRFLALISLAVGILLIYSA